ncbi:MAG: nucleoside-diphosphate kinase [Rickettsiales bacterium]|nr:nucleoside-diphosphate kinase [Rickettsiales bacterium]
MVKSMVLASLLLSALSVSARADIVANSAVKNDIVVKEIAEQNIAGPAVVKVDKNKWILQRTFGVIKPSGMGKISEIKSIIAAYGLEMRYSKKITLTEAQVEKLYEMHKDKPFFEDLKSSLAGKDVIVFILYGKDAVKRYRDAVKEIRSKYALNKTENAVHGSDSWERGKEEINMFFRCNNKTCK